MTNDGVKVTTYTVGTIDSKCRFYLGQNDRFVEHVVISLATDSVHEVGIASRISAGIQCSIAEIVFHELFD